MKHIFIVNPTAGKTDYSDTLVKEVKKVFEEGHYRIKITKGKGDATQIVRRFAQTGEAICFYACGGDGTLNEVVNGMYMYPNAKLAILPTGTGNDFVKVFPNLKREDFLTLANYRDPIMKSCDLLKVDQYVSINATSVGLDVTIAKNVDKFRKLPLIKGIMPYYLSLLYSMMFSLSAHFSVIIDGKKLHEQEYSFIVASNGRYYGGGFMPSPNAEIDNGFIDAVLIKKVTRRKIVRLAGAYKKGNHLQYTDLVNLHKCKKMQILSKDKVHINLDGEIIEAINPAIEVLEKQITICLPNVL